MSSLIQQYDVDAPHFDHTEELPKVMDNEGALCGRGHQRKICKQTTKEDYHRLTTAPTRSAKSKASPKFLLLECWSRTPA